ncbi:MAG: ATP-dependent zinc metalloprotease FtsH [Planctomycetota bacterium]|jgi:cell division protease FtsH
MAEQEPTKPKMRFPLWPIILALVILLIVGSSFTSSGADEIYYNQFRQLLRWNRITKITITETEIKGEYIPGEGPLIKKDAAAMEPKIGDEVIAKLNDGKEKKGLLEEFEGTRVVSFQNWDNSGRTFRIPVSLIPSYRKAGVPGVGPGSVGAGNASKTGAREKAKKPFPGGCAPGRTSSDKKKKNTARFVTKRVEGDEELIKDLEASGIEYEQELKSEFLSIFLMWIVPIGLIILFWIFLSRMSGGVGREVMSFGKSKAKIVAERNVTTNFGDVAGCEEAKEELEEVVEYLKKPDKFQKLGGTIPKGVLLVGPPGTGKTLMARAVAGEAGVPFFSISGSDFVEMFVGVGAARVRDMFNQAKDRAPCIVFIDEIDAVGRHRGAGLGGGHDEREQTLNQLLVEMDGFEANRGVIIIAATNRPDILDPALLRPGRFDRQVVLDQPDKRGRHEILNVHARGKPLAKDVDLEVIARRTPGFSGADLENVLNESALLAARRNKDEIAMSDIEQATERVMTGPERKSRIITDKEKKTIAVHELGHAMVAQMLENADPVHKVSIIPRGHGIGGYTLVLPEEDKYLVTRSEIIDNIQMTLGGRVAEEVFFGEVSTGATNDLAKASNMARSMVCRFGMSERLGPIQYEDMEHNPFLGKTLSEQKSRFSEETLQAIDEEVRKIIEESYEVSKKIVTEHKDFIGELVELLLEKESIGGLEFARLVEKKTGVKKYSAHFKEDDEEVKKQVEKPENDKEEPGAAVKEEPGAAVKEEADSPADTEVKSD